MPRKRKAQPDPLIMGSTPSKKKRDSFEDDPSSSPPPSSPLEKARSTSSLSADSAIFSPTRCSQWFDKYKDPVDDTIGPDGIEKFCEDVGVTPDNVVMLLIAWKMAAATMGYFTREEWMNGMKKMNCDSVQKMKNQTAKLLAELNEAASFKDIYRYSFDFSKEKNQKSMDIATAQGMIMLLMKDRSKHTEPFLTFLEEKKPVKVVNKDQWMSFLEFSEAIAPDLSNYDEMSAWPVLLDEYVAWRKENPPLS